MNLDHEQEPPAEREHGALPDGHDQAEDAEGRPQPLGRDTVTTYPEPGANLTGTGLTRTCLYHLDGEDINALDPERREALLEWVRAHGLVPARITTSAPLLIYREPDGRHFIKVRVTDDPPTACENCDGCVRTKALWVEWNGTPPPRGLHRPRTRRTTRRERTVTVQWWGRRPWWRL